MVIDWSCIWQRCPLCKIEWKSFCNRCNIDIINSYLYGSRNFNNLMRESYYIRKKIPINAISHYQILWSYNCQTVIQKFEDRYLFEELFIFEEPLDLNITKECIEKMTLLQ